MGKKREYNYQNVDPKADAMDDWRDEQQKMISDEQLRTQQISSGNYQDESGPPVSYTVPADTDLFRLANHFIVSPAEVWKMNSWYFSLRSGFSIKAGTILNLPGSALHTKERKEQSPEIPIPFPPLPGKDSDKNNQIKVKADKSVGDEPGTPKNIPSQKVMGPVKHIMQSLKVKFEGRKVQPSQTTPQQQPQEQKQNTEPPVSLEPAPNSPAEIQNENTRGATNDSSFFDMATSQPKTVPQQGAVLPEIAAAETTWPFIDLPDDRSGIAYNTPLTKSIIDRFHWNEVMARFKETSPLGSHGLSKTTLDQWVMKNLGLGWVSSMAAPSIFDTFVLTEKGEWKGSYYDVIEAFSGPMAFAAATLKLQLVPNVGQGFLWQRKNSGSRQYMGYGFSEHAAQGMENYELNKGTAIDFQKIGRCAQDSERANQVMLLSNFREQMYSDEFYFLVCKLQEVLKNQEGSKLDAITGIYDATTRQEFEAYALVRDNNPPVPATTNANGQPASSKSDSQAVLISKLYYICGDLDLYRNAIKEEEDYSALYGSARPVMLNYPAFNTLASAASNILFWTGSFSKPLPPTNEFYTEVDNWGITFHGDESLMDKARIARYAQIEYDSYNGKRAALVSERDQLKRDIANAEASRNTAYDSFLLLSLNTQIDNLKIEKFYGNYTQYQTNTQSYIYNSSLQSGQAPTWNATEFPTSNPYDVGWKNPNPLGLWNSGYNVVGDLTSQTQFIDGATSTLQEVEEMRGELGQTVEGNYERIQTSLFEKRSKMGFELGGSSNGIVVLWGNVQQAYMYYANSGASGSATVSVQQPVTQTAVRDETNLYSPYAISHANERAVSCIKKSIAPYTKNPIDIQSILLTVISMFLENQTVTSYAGSLPSRYADENKTSYTIDELISIVNELYDLYAFSMLPQKDLVPGQMAELEESARRLKETETQYGDMHLLPMRFQLQQNKEEVEKSGLSGGRKSATSEGISFPVYWKFLGNGHYELVIDLGDRFVTKYTNINPVGLYGEGYKAPFINYPGKTTPAGTSGSEQQDSEAIVQLIGQLSNHELPAGQLNYVTPDKRVHYAKFEKPWPVAEVLGWLSIAALIVALPFALFALAGAATLEAGLIAAGGMMTTAGTVAVGFGLGSIVAGLYDKEQAGTLTSGDMALAGLNALAMLLPLPGIRAPIMAAAGEYSVLAGRVFAAITVTDVVVNGYIIRESLLASYDEIQKIPDEKERQAAIRQLLLIGLLNGALLWQSFKGGMKEFNTKVEGGYIHPDILEVYHTKGNQFAKSVFEEIDPSFFRNENRFGKGLYVAEKGATSIAEVVYHGGEASTSSVITFEMNMSKMKVLDLTDPNIQKQWGWSAAVEFENRNATYLKFQEIANEARSTYNAIKYPSFRAEGVNFVILETDPLFYKMNLKPLEINPAVK